MDLFYFDSCKEEDARLHALSFLGVNDCSRILSIRHFRFLQSIPRWMVIRRVISKSPNFLAEELESGHLTSEKCKCGPSWIDSQNSALRSSFTMFLSYRCPRCRNYFSVLLRGKSRKGPD